MTTSLKRIKKEEELIDIKYLQMTQMELSKVHLNLKLNVLHNNNNKTFLKIFFFFYNIFSTKLLFNQLTYEISIGMKRALQFCAEAMAFAQWTWRPLYRADAFVFPKYISNSANDLIEDIQPIALVFNQFKFCHCLKSCNQGAVGDCPMERLRV